MKIATIFSIVFSVIIVFAACKKKEAEPQCPECWDQKAVCVDAVCQCPEGTIVIDQTGMNWVSQIRFRVPENNLFCLEPDQLTFLAEFDTIGCYRTLAIQFPVEPLRFAEEWTSPFGSDSPSSISKWLRLLIRLDNSRERRSCGFVSLYIEVWASGNAVGRSVWHLIQSMDCVDLDAACWGPALRHEATTTWTNVREFEGYMGYRIKTALPGRKPG